MARRTYGTGGVSAYQTKAGKRFCARWRVGGKEDRQCGFLTHKEAADYAKKMSVRKDEGLAVEPNRLTVADLMAAHEQATWHDLAPATTARYQQVVRLHIVPYLGATRLKSRLQPHVCETWLRELREAETGARTMQQAYDRLHAALAWAWRMGWVEENVLAKVDRPKSTPEPIFPLSFAEAAAFLVEADKHRLAPLWRLYLYTGLRRGEGLGLRWSDLDLEAGKLSVRQQVVPGKTGGGAVVSPILKTSAARRTFGIDPVLVDKLRDHQERQDAIRRRTEHWFGRGLVFCTRNGLPLAPRNLYDDFKPLLERAGVAVRNLHSLRHTHASHLLAQGVSLLEVSARLGHANPQITAAIYAHYIPDHNEASVEAITALLQGAGLPALAG